MKTKNEKQERCCFCGNNQEKVISAQYDGNEEPIGICKTCILNIGEMFGIKVTNSPIGNTFVHEQQPLAQGQPKVNVASGGIDTSFNCKPPKEIFSQLQSHIIGQDRYLKALSLFGYNHVRRLSMIAQGMPVHQIPVKSNLLVVGPTGTGKTHAINWLAKILNVVVSINDVTSITEAGYVGNDVEDILRNLLISCDGSIERASSAIIMLDEVDKIATKKANGRDISGEGVQHALLKIIEGGEQSVPVPMSPPKTGGSREPREQYTLMDTKNISFIGCGAFTGLKTMINEDGSSVGFRGGRVVDKEEVAYKLVDGSELTENLMKWGMLPEFLGRFNLRSVLNPLNVSDLKHILLDPEDSIIKTETVRFEKEGISLSFEDSAIDAFAAQAQKEKLGARPLTSKVHNVLMDAEFECFGTGITASVRVYAKDGEVTAEIIK